MRSKLLVDAYADRYEAAIRLERIRQTVREYLRYGVPVTAPHFEEMERANAEYDAATKTADYVEQIRREMPTRITPDQRYVVEWRA